MPTFEYTALNEDGDELSGRLDAAGKQEALQALNDLHLTPKNMQEIGGTTIPVSPTPAIKTTPVVTPTAATSAPTPSSTASVSSALQRYFPLMDTLRLYAGWLLAWYAIVVALGYYTRARTLPFSIPFVSSLFASPLVFSFLLATFCFLLFSSIARALKGGTVVGAVSAIAGIAMFVIVKLQF